MLTDSCPSFTDKWEKHKREYADEENYLIYIALGEFVGHLIELEKHNQTSEFENVFELVEKFHTEGEHYVKEATTIGLLESLQNILGNNEEKFVRYLKPESLRWWNKLNKFWNGEIKFVGETINQKCPRKIFITRRLKMR